LFRSRWRIEGVDVGGTLDKHMTMPYSDVMKLVATSGYARRVCKLLTDDERASAELTLALVPDAWPVIPGTGGCRKARVGRGGKGKSGGARIVYYVMTAHGVLYLLDIYAKGAKEDLTHAERNEIRRFVEALEAEA
jgi:hypothetical protein